VPSSSQRRRAPAPPGADSTAELQRIPNVGPSLAASLRQVGVRRPNDLVGRDPYVLYDALCHATGVRQDPCVLDVFISAVRFAEGAPARPWWHYTAERKRALRERSAAQPSEAR
jgi:hypothetical protein